MRDKYVFIQTRKSAQVIATEYRDRLSDKNDPLHFLCAMNLQKFMNKLWAHCNSVGGRPLKKITLNKQEALAFWVDYTAGFMNTDCPFVTEIYTEIDRSLNNEPVKPNEKLK